MQIRNYNNELKTASVMFASLFRSMRITRSDDDENKTRKTIDIPVVLATRSRIFKNLENYLAQSALTLPLVTIERTGISIVPSRITNLHNEIANQEQEGRINYDLYTPVPIDISFKVVLVSRFLTDIDMMIGQILPFFNTDVYVSHRHPKYRNVKYSSQVVMGNDISVSSSPEISKDQDEIHTAEMSFTYKTYIFGGTKCEDMGVINPYTAPITKIGAEVHMVPYLEPDVEDIGRNSSGFIEPSQDLSQVQEATIPNYFNKLENGEVPYPEYEMLDWIMDYQYNDETGELELPYDPNKPFGYEIEEGDGLTYVNHKHRLYDQEVEITPDHMVQTIQSQNYVNQWGLPWKPIETRPWNDIDDYTYEDESELEKELQSQNPMGTEDYTEQ